MSHIEEFSKRTETYDESVCETENRVKLTTGSQDLLNAMVPVHQMTLSKFITEIHIVLMADNSTHC